MSNFVYIFFNSKIKYDRNISSFSKWRHLLIFREDSLSQEEEKKSMFDGRDNINDHFLSQLWLLMLLLNRDLAGNNATTLACMHQCFAGERKKCSFVHDPLNFCLRRFSPQSWDLHSPLVCMA